MTDLAADLTFEPVTGLVDTWEVCDHDRRVLGVIAEVDEFDWRVITTRYGAPEPVTGRHPTREAAAATLLPPEAT